MANIDTRVLVTDSAGMGRYMQVRTYPDRMTIADEGTGQVMTIALTTSVEGANTGDQTAETVPLGATWGLSATTVADGLEELSGEVGSLGGRTYLIREPDPLLPSATVMGSLATGILRNTTTTGVPVIAVAADFPTLNQNTSGTAASVTSAAQPAITSVGMLTSLQVGTVTDNYTVEADGTRKSNGAATTWVDIDFPVIVKTTGVGVPTIATLQGNLTMPQWAVGDAQQCESQEMVHLWKEASPVTFHVHFITGGTDTTNRYINFEVEYTWANFGGTLPANTVVTSGDILIPANTPALTHLLANLSTWTPTGGKIASHVKARLKRIASTGTAPTANPFCEMLQLHIECDTDGSRNATTK